MFVAFVKYIAIPVLFFFYIKFDWPLVITDFCTVVTDLCTAVTDFCTVTDF